MPDRDATERQSARQLTAMIWTGVGLVPVAVLIVLAGGGDRSLRFAVLLMAVSVVLVGASLLIRNDPELLRMDVADRVADEAGALRDELREEVAAAARATHHRVQALQDEVARLQQERMPSGPVWPAPDPAPDPTRGHLPGAVVPAARGAVTGAAQVPQRPADHEPRPPAVPMGVPTGVGRGRAVAGPGQSVPVRSAGSVPVARAAATVRPVGSGFAAAPAAPPVDRPAGGLPGPLPGPTARPDPAPGGRRTQPDDVRRPRRGERRGRRSADRDSEAVEAAPSSWLAEPDSGWLIRPGEHAGAAEEVRPAAEEPEVDDVPWSYQREPSRRHRSADADAGRPADAEGPRYGAEPGRRRRRAPEETDDSW